MLPSFGPGNEASSGYSSCTVPSLGLGLGLGPGKGFFLPVLKVTNTFVLYINGSCDVHGVCDVRTATVHDVTMMYSKERYMENVLVVQYLLHNQ